METASRPSEAYAGERDPVSGVVSCASAGAASRATKRATFTSVSGERLLIGIQRYRDSWVYGSSGFSWKGFKGLQERKKSTESVTPLSFRVLLSDDSPHETSPLVRDPFPTTSSSVMTWIKTTDPPQGDAAL